MLKPQDVLVTLKLLVLDEDTKNHSFSSLASSLGLSVSETHGSVNRAVGCHLLSSTKTTDRRRNALPSASVGNVLRFVEHGLPYVLPAEKGAVVLGMPTGIGASPLRDYLAVGAEEFLPVWQWSTGTCKGISLKPIFRSCPLAASNDPQLYKLLCLVDAIRDEGVRQRQVAIKLFTEEIHSITSRNRSYTALS
jgi:hypothetical protein